MPKRKMIINWHKGLTNTAAIITQSSPKQTRVKLLIMEKSMRQNPIHFIAIFSLGLLVFLSGCGLIQSFRATSTPTIVPTPIATATPLPDRAILITASETDATFIAEAQTLLAELSGNSGLLFETRNEISAGEITPDVKVIIFLTHPENLGTLASNAPKTQFAVISDLNWNPISNVTIIRKKPDNIAFIAGFISVILDNNFRGGALISAEDGTTLSSFINGAHYFCGLCAADIPPYSKYPLTASLPGGSPAVDWQAEFDKINVGLVRVLFIAPEAYSPELFNYLNSKEIILLGLQTPPQEILPRWAVTLKIDSLSPFREIWPDLVAGVGGKVVYGGVSFTDVNPAYLTRGKLDYVQKMVEKLRSGLIDPQSVPNE